MTRLRRNRVQCENVILTGMWGFCTRCGGFETMSDLGLRRMGDGTIRNQPQCKRCRSLKPCDRDDPNERHLRAEALSHTLHVFAYKLHRRGVLSVWSKATIGSARWHARELVRDMFGRST